MVSEGNTCQPLTNLLQIHFPPSPGFSLFPVFKGRIKGAPEPLDECRDLLPQDSRWIPTAFNSYNFVTTSWHSQRRWYTQTLKPDLNKSIHIWSKYQTPSNFWFRVFINLSLFPYFSIYYLYFPNMLILHEIYTHICSFLWLDDCVFLNLLQIWFSFWRSMLGRDLRWCEIWSDRFHEALI